MKTTTFKIARYIVRYFAYGTWNNVLRTYRVLSSARKRAEKLLSNPNITAVEIVIGAVKIVHVLRDRLGRNAALTHV